MTEPEENEEELSPEKEEEHSKEHQRYIALATCLGLNELAKLGKTLGEKVYARLSRDMTLQRFIDLGGNADLFAEEEALCVITLDKHLPWIQFREQDIELMREVVKKYDEEKKTPAPPDGWDEAVAALWALHAKDPSWPGLWAVTTWLDSKTGREMRGKK